MICGNACVDPKTDDANCGACGTVCNVGNCLAGRCEAAPIASAGKGQVVPSGSLVGLDASASADPDGDKLTFKWTQTTGPTVMITGGDAARARFTAPTVSLETQLTFQISVSDGMKMSTDHVDVMVTPAPQETGCSVALGGKSAGGAALVLVVLGLCLVLRRRRRL